MTYVLVSCISSISYAQSTSSEATGKAFSFLGVDYKHQWSKNGQNEFTPNDEVDLESWNNMVTVNVHETISSEEQLADVANKVLGNYQGSGKVLRTDSKPTTADRPAEHFIVAVLGAPGFLEATFARFILVEGIGTVVVYSHRVYGKNAGPAMSDWLKANGPKVENALMAWNEVPRFADLKRLPQSN